jgi:hypothetical protein
MFNFVRNCQIVYKVSVLFFTPQARYIQAFQLFHILIVTWFFALVWFLNFSHQPSCPSALAWTFKKNYRIGTKHFFGISSAFKGTSRTFLPWAKNMIPEDWGEMGRKGRDGTNIPKGYKQIDNKIYFLSWFLSPKHSFRNRTYWIFKKKKNSSYN